MEDEGLMEIDRHKYRVISTSQGYELGNRMVETMYLIASQKLQFFISIVNLTLSALSPFPFPVVATYTFTHAQTSNIILTSVHILVAKAQSLDNCNTCSRFPQFVSVLWWETLWAPAFDTISNGVLNRTHAQMSHPRCDHEIFKLKDLCRHSLLPALCYIVVLCQDEDQDEDGELRTEDGDLEFCVAVWFRCFQRLSIHFFTL